MLPGTVRFNYPVLNIKTFLCLTKQINSIAWSGAPFSVQLPDAEIIRPLPDNCPPRVSGCREMGSRPFICHTGNKCLTMDTVSMRTSSEPVCAESLVLTPHSFITNAYIFFRIFVKNLPPGFNPTTF